MDARKTPRTKTSFQVTLTSKASGVEQIRVVEDISQSGFFVSSLSTSKIDDLYQIEIKKPDQSNSLQLVARVTRINNQGCGLSFDHLQQHESQFLSELTNPKWDGKDLLEGVIMHGVLENTTDFATCMRLTSLLSSGYRHANRLH
ncbi:MAG: PilZ domain-containing protein [Candidatus Thiodiazotropha sp. (ex Lucinoma kastoroae)]|nr:PilZ domain-containing protein [Candidatus Thiodiazotropha sp. (ex Rostrolucina anterorostrata)]MCU7850139.1 PilZ domain-containing protein [Candidatus Thiodiazotropha sp. (ex Lucinoma kastoroae)]